MAAANPLFENVPGAPVEIGQQVTVRRVIDEQGDASFVGKMGFVVALEYACGCGQVFPESPMIIVQFDGGATEEFWHAELTR